MARLGQPVDLKYWYISPQTVGAMLVFQQNSYVMSAALLEPPKYDHASSDAAAYGSIGALIGHDLTHYIDVLGADYDTEHRMRHWWTPEDKQRFQALTQPLVDQFSAYQPLPGLSINGKLTLTENIADLGGLAAAFDAYRKTLGGRARMRTPCAAQDREFFIAYAQTLGERSARARCGRRWPRTTTRRKSTGPTRCATSTPGTTRSTSARVSGCTSSPRRACGSGKRRANKVEATLHEACAGRDRVRGAETGLEGAFLRRRRAWWDWPESNRRPRV